MMMLLAIPVVPAQSTRPQATLQFPPGQWAGVIPPSPLPMMVTVQATGPCDEPDKAHACCPGPFQMPEPASRREQPVTTPAYSADLRKEEAYDHSKMSDYDEPPGAGDYDLDISQMSDYDEPGHCSIYDDSSAALPPPLVAPAQMQTPQVSALAVAHLSSAGADGEKTRETSTASTAREDRESISQDTRATLAPPAEAPKAKGRSRRGGRNHGRATDAATLDMAKKSQAPRAIGPCECDSWPSDTTSVMVRNISTRYTVEEVLAEFNFCGFEGTYDFFYLPMDFKTKRNMGYAFINFTEPEVCKRFARKLHGTRFTRYSSEKTIEVALAVRQGLEANVSQYSMKDSDRVRNPWFRPLIFK